MITVNGKYGFAKVFAEKVEDAALQQIESLLGNPALKGSKIRIMPDVHAGMGSVIGFTMTMGDYVIPNFVGVDIGCGVLAVELGPDEIDFPALDVFIREAIPVGFAHHQDGLRVWALEETAVLRVLTDKVCEETGQATAEALASVGTLGGGNHFIEIGLDDTGSHWLFIHSGSRGFGYKVCRFYQERARSLAETMKLDDSLKGMEFLPLELGGADYLGAMKVAQLYAETNRRLMANTILEDGLRLEGLTTIDCAHNYIDMEAGILRKGAISAQAGESVLIPLTMRAGVIIGKGLGNANWNFSAPHGAGRVMSRKQAKEALDVDEFRAQMKGVFSTSIGPATLDEAPGAYRDPAEILNTIGETVEVERIVRPVFNLKADGRK